MSNSICSTCSQQPAQLALFLETLREEYKRVNIAFPENVLTMRFDDLIYTVRFQAVVRLIKDQGLCVDSEDFNNMVNGRMSVAQVQEHLCSITAAQLKLPTLVQIVELVDASTHQAIKRLIGPSFS